MSENQFGLTAAAQGGSLRQDGGWHSSRSRNRTGSRSRRRFGAFS